MATDKADRPTVKLLETAALLQAQCQEIEEERSGGIHDLREREKQIQFLYQFNLLAAQTNLHPDEFIREFLDLIPTLWQHPDETSARIFLHDREYRTTNFIVESDWKFAANIVADNQSIGSLELFYIEGYPDDYQGVLIWRESSFIETIVSVISSFLQNCQAVEKFQTINDQYENIVQSHQKLESRIGGFVPKLKLMNEKFQKTLETKNSFIKQIGHEIIHQIERGRSGFTDRPDLDQRDERTDPTLDHLICLGEKIEQYVDYEAGNFVQENKPFSIRSMLAEVLKNVRSKASDQKINIIPMINPLIPDKVSGDGQKIKQVISYLIDYGLEISKSGQVIIKVELEASAHLLPIYSFSVILSGCLDSETEPSKILRLNSSLNTTDENDFMISRLGVVISRQSIELMGGEIWIEGGSDINGQGYPGISFQFTTWLDIDKEHDERTFCLDLPDTASYNILVADQNLVMCEMLDDYFATLGFAVTIAPDSNTASTILEESFNKKSDWLLAIIDAEMALDSEQTLLDLGIEKGWLENTPIILIGPEECRSLATEQARDQMVKFAPKPFDFWHFDLLVRQVLEKIKPVEPAPDRQPAPSPEAKAEAEADNQPVVEPTDVACSQDDQKRLAIISPDKVTRIMLTKILEKQSYEIEAVSLVSEVEASITAGKIDGLLIDLHPNLIDPDRFIQKIRLAENFTGHHLPIITILSPESGNIGEKSEATEEGRMADRVINISDGYGPLCDQIRLLIDQFGPQNRTGSDISQNDEIVTVGFDRQTALKLANDDMDLLLELLEVFDEEADEYMSQMKLAVQMQKPEDLKLAARALEHSASKIGAVEVKRLALQIINSMSNEEMATVGKPLQELQVGLEKFSKEVARYEESVAM